MSEALRPTSVGELVADFVEDPARINFESLLFLHRASVNASEDFLAIREALTAALATRSDDDRIAMIVEKNQILEEFYARMEPVKWVGELVENSLFATLHARRVEANVSKIAIPHSAVTIELEAKHEYDPDPYALEMIAADLPDEEAAKIVTIVPEHDLPERTVVLPAEHVPKQIIVGHTVSILSIMKKYTGTPIAAALDAAMGRKVLSEKLTIKPRKTAANALKRTHEEK